MIESALLTEEKYSFEVYYSNHDKGHDDVKNDEEKKVNNQGEIFLFPVRETTSRFLYLEGDEVDGATYLSETVPGTENLKITEKAVQEFRLPEIGKTYHSDTEYSDKDIEDKDDYIYDKGKHDEVETDDYNIHEEDDGKNSTGKRRDDVIKKGRDKPYMRESNDTDDRHGFPYMRESNFYLFISKTPG